jgi:WD40-like Beta Propeller Repeat
MVAGGVRVGRVLAAGLFLLAAGCSPAATVPRPGPPPTAPTAGFPADFIGISSLGGDGVVAVYSAVGGSLIRTLTAPMPGGGPGGPQLSPDGRTVIFSRGTGTCAQIIDTVPFRGGPEQTLIAITGRPLTGNSYSIPDDPSYSPDGRYLIYDTVPCGPSGHVLVHIRALSTGHERARAVAQGYAFSAFLDHDSEVVGGTGTGLEVLRLPSMAVTAYPAPRGCQYQGLAGTDTELVALLQCGPGHQLSVVAISARTFTVTRTLIGLGSCLGGQTISLAPPGPSAMLVELYNACVPPTAPGGYTIVKILDGHVWFVTSGQDVPQGASW